MTKIETSPTALSAKIRERAEEASLGSRGKLRYRLVPRWTCGSPGNFTSLSQCLRPALWEVRHWNATKEGLEGDEREAEARAPNALRGVFLSYYETRCHWEVFDLLTGEKWIQPLSGRKRCKHSRIPLAKVDRILQSIPWSEGDMRVRLCQLSPILTGKRVDPEVRIGEPTFEYRGEVLW